MRKPDATTMPVTMTGELVYQFGNLLDVLSVTIRPIPRKHWCNGTTPFQTPVRLACHIASSCDAYTTLLSSQDPISGHWFAVPSNEHSRCTQRFGCPVDTLDIHIPADQLPSVTQVLSYVATVRQGVSTWLGTIHDKDLLTETRNWGWRERGATVLGHILYILRHGTLHLGHLKMELYARGIASQTFR